MATSSDRLSLHDEVTVVLVTSYTPACPSTALIEATLASFAFVPGLTSCRTVIVADGYIASCNSRKTKMGRLTAADAAPYAAYVEALSERVVNARGGAAASCGRPLPEALAHATVLALDSHHGFGWAVKAALNSGLVETPRILVVQHDRAFMRPFDLERAVGCMRADDRIRYLLVPTRSTRNHAQTMWCNHGVRLPRLEVSGVGLLQLAFWWDSTHLATCAHYRDFVLRHPTLRRGCFPEDTVGRQLLAEVKLRGVAAAEPYHAYLWENANESDADNVDGGVVGHLNGAHWRAWAADAGGPADAAGAAPLHNSRLSHFHKAMATLGGEGVVAPAARPMGDPEDPEDESNDESNDVSAASSAAAAGWSAATPRTRPRARVDVSVRVLPPEWPSPDTVRLYVRLLEPSTCEADAEADVSADASADASTDARAEPGATSAGAVSVRPIVTVVLPIFNGEPWLDGCMEALLAQTWVVERGLHRVGSPNAEHAGRIELSAFDDGSHDATWARLLDGWAPHLRACGWRVVLDRHDGPPGGCGFAKNRAVAQSSGAWLLFQDIDDISLPERLSRQLEAAAREPSALIGTRVRREPEGSTARYTAWANEMSAQQLVLHRFRECTLLMPTWFLSRASFERAGGFAEEKCEDLLFLQAHVRRGGRLCRVDHVLEEHAEHLVVYRYHAAAATHAIPRQTILRHRTAALERDQIGDPVLEQLWLWPTLTIWGAGRDGREFFKALRPETRRRVTAFCDVDPKKVGTTYQYFEHFVPVVHFRDAAPPFVLCVALDRTNGGFEANLASLGLREGKDFLHFG